MSNVIAEPGPPYEDEPYRSMSGAEELGIDEYGSMMSMDFGNIDIIIIDYN